MKKCIVIGGGIIGLSTAYFLVKEGHQVQVFDQSKMDAGASYVNAGYVSPGHIMPLASPGVMTQGLKWMFNPKSPLFIKPRLDPGFIHWALAFRRSCSPKNVETSIKAIKDITLLSQQLYQQIRQEEGLSFHLEQKGLLMLFQTQKGLDKECKVVRRAVEEGLEAREITLDQLVQLEPNTTINALGAVQYQCDWHSTPGEFMQQLKNALLELGVEIHTQVRVESFTTDQGKITSVKTPTHSWSADEYVVAAGSWSARLCKQLGIKIPLEAGKGYRINSQRQLGIEMPAILGEAKVAVSPMNGFTRFGGTMEIGGINHEINPKRVQAIAEAVQAYYPELKLSDEELSKAACGLRPVSPDGRPYIGKSSRCNNLTIASGHAMMGWSMGPATGKLVAELISEQKPSLDMGPFHPDRQF